MVYIKVKGNKKKYGMSLEDLCKVLDKMSEVATLTTLWGSAPCGVSLHDPASPVRA